MAISTTGIYATAYTKFIPNILSFSSCAFILNYKERIIIYIEQAKDGSWIARNPSIMTHGVGENCEEALADYQEMLIDYFKSLVESEEILAPHLHRQLDYLRTLLPEEIIDLG